MSFTLSPRAEADIEEIGDYIAQDDPDAAERLIENFRDKFIALGSTPKIGRARPDIANDARHFPVGNYLILYRLTGKGVQIVRVVHGRRNITSDLFGQ